MQNCLAEGPIYPDEHAHPNNQMSNRNKAMVEQMLTSLLVLNFTFLSLDGSSGLKLYFMFCSYYPAGVFLTFIDFGAINLCSPHTGD